MTASKLQISGSSPYKRKGSPYWWIRRVIPGLGELRLSTRTKNGVLAQRYDMFICELRENGRTDALMALREQKVSLRELYQNQSPAYLNSVLVRANSPLLKPLVDEWLTIGANDSGIRDRSMQRYASSWKRLWEIIPSNAKLDDLSQALVSKFKRHRIEQSKLLERPLSGATLNRDLAALGAFLTWCSDEKDIGVTRPRLKYYEESKGRTRWLTKEELIAFRQECSDQWWPLFGLLLSTGITISEALGLRRTDIDLTTGRLSIHEEYGRKLKRASRNRELHIPEAMRPALRQWLDASVEQKPDDRIFPFTYWPVRKVWHSICDRAKIHGATVHDTRHTFAVHAVQSGIPEARLQKLLGHAHPGTTRRYAMHAPEAFLEKDARSVSGSMGLANPI